MTEVKKKYKVVHVHYYEKLRTVLLCLESTEKIYPPPTFIHAGSEDEKVMGKMVQSTVQALRGIMPPQYLEENLLKVEITLEEYEKLGKPGILDEITLTLDFKKETT